MLKRLRVALLLAFAAPLRGQEPIAAPRQFFAHVETTKGTFVLEINRDWAPRGADRFFALVTSGFFDDSRFFRVIPNFIVQFGIARDSATSARWSGATFPDDSATQSNTVGTIAFAMRGPNDRTTQLFISVVDNSRLDAQGFAPIGRVVDGMGVVKSIYSDYGENSGGGVRAGKQAALLNGGSAYLDRAYPRLDRLKRVWITDRP